MYYCSHQYFFCSLPDHTFCAFALAACLWNLSRSLLSSKTCVPRAGCWPLTCIFSFPFAPGFSVCCYHELPFLVEISFTSLVFVHNTLLNYQYALVSLVQSAPALVPSISKYVGSSCRWHRKDFVGLRLLIIIQRPWTQYSRVTKCWDAEHKPPHEICGLESQFRFRNLKYGSLLYVNMIYLEYKTKNTESQTVQETQQSWQSSMITVISVMTAFSERVLSHEQLQLQLYLFHNVQLEWHCIA